jgi:hypothetical protein
MLRRMSERPPPRRASIALLCLVHAAVFGAAAAVLPWPTFTMFALVTGALALAHAVTAVAAMAGAGLFPRAWRATSLLSLGVLGYLTYACLGSGLYVNLLYDGVGTAIAAAAVAAWCVAVLFTAPFAAWGIAATGGLFRRAAPPRERGLLALLVVVLAGWGVSSDAATARGRRRVLEDDAEIGRAVAAAVAGARARSIAGEAPQSFVTAAVGCPAPPSAFEGATAFVTFVSTDGAPRSACAQHPTLEASLAEVRRVLDAGWDRGDATIDVVIRVRPLPDAGPLLGAVVVRPGMEGVCEGARCLLPWQLFGLDAFTEATNVAALQAELGVTAAALRKHLGAAAGDFAGLDAFETRTFWLRPDGALDSVRHLRAGPRSLARADLEGALRDAVAYVVSSQEADGRFRYTVDPFSGAVSFANFSVPRQAGTTLALCELARFGAGAKAAAAKSLAMLAGLEQQAGDRGGIIHPKGAPKRAALGPTALTTAALLTCRPVTGTRHDESIVRLASTLLALQRPDGGFRPAWDPRTDTVVEGKDPLYAAGQAVLSLVLWEATDLPKPEGLRDAIDRAMRYYAGPYWDVPLRDFFYLEENWHCLAARAALGHHRHDGYERFCIDYMTMKSRFIQTAESGIDQDLVGAYAFGHLFPPHHTATAGFGEALAAAMAIKRARGMPTERDEDTMRLVVSYLLRHQWRDDNCAMCTRKVRISGAFSEHVASPIVRIDFVQHAMAAMFHGSEVLGLLGAAP